MSLTAGHGIGTAEPARWRELSAALTEAFDDDPVFSWLLPDAATRTAALRRFFAIETRHIALRHRQSTTTAGTGEVAGAALILPPGSGAPRCASRRCTRPVTSAPSAASCPVPWAH